MKLLEREFELEEDYPHRSRPLGPGVRWMQVTKSRIHYAAICTETLNTLFVIPHTVNRIWISLHDTRSSNRVSAKIVPRKTCGFVVSSRHFCLSSPLWNRYLRPHAGRTLYMQVEYEEKSE